MYVDFYALKKAPFHITPDPAFLFLSPSHKAALGALVYGIEARQGFVALIGEVGVGKTTILRSYLERVDPAHLKTIYIFNANVSFSALLQTICRECGLAVTPEDVFDTVNRLHQVLIEEYHQGRNVALIVDEAQHIPLETLEHLRMLSNLETSTQKLMQMVLVGQPEFEAKLNEHALRQLKQRVVIRATIAPLTAKESLEYIAHRLAKVRLTDAPIFTRRALRQIIQHAKGTPRVLNILCTNALIQGFGARQQRISARIAKQVIADYSGKRSRWRWRPWMALTGATALLVVVFLCSPYPHMGWSKMDNKSLIQHTLASITQSIASPSSTRVRPPQETPAAPHDSVPPLSERIPALPLERESQRLETPPAPLTPRVTPIPLSSITPRVTTPPPAIPPPSALLTSPPSAPLSPRVTAPSPATPMGMGLKSCDKLKAEIQAKLDAKSLTGYTLTIMAHGDVKGQQVVGSCESNTKKIVFNRSQNAQ